MKKPTTDTVFVIQMHRTMNQYNNEFTNAEFFAISPGSFRNYDSLDFVLRFVRALFIMVE